MNINVTALTYQAVRGAVLSTVANLRTRPLTFRLFIYCPTASQVRVRPESATPSRSQQHATPRAPKPTQRYTERADVVTGTHLADERGKRRRERGREERWGGGGGGEASRQRHQRLCGAGIISGRFRSDVAHSFVILFISLLSVFPCGLFPSLSCPLNLFIFSQSRICGP